MESLSFQTTAGYQQIHDGIIHLVDSARTETVRSVNALMTATYWEIGRRIVEFEQGGEARAAYGTQLIKRLSKDLSLRYKRGFSAKNLRQMRLFTFFINILKFGRHCLPNLCLCPGPLMSACFPLKTLTPAAFMKKRRSAVAGLFAS